MARRTVDTTPTMGSPCTSASLHVWEEYGCIVATLVDLGNMLGNAPQGLKRARRDRLGKSSEGLVAKAVELRAASLFSCTCAFCVGAGVSHIAMSQL